MGGVYLQAFITVRISESEKPPFYRTWVSTTRPINPEKQGGRLVLGIINLTNMVESTKQWLIAKQSQGAILPKANLELG